MAHGPLRGPFEKLKAEFATVAPLDEYLSRRECDAENGSVSPPLPTESDFHGIRGIKGCQQVLASLSISLRFKREAGSAAAAAG